MIYAIVFWLEINLAEKGVNTNFSRMIGNRIVFLPLESYSD